MYTSVDTTERGATSKGKLSRITVSQRIEADIRRRIGNSQWLPGEPLPSRRDLAKEYGVGLRTLQIAIAGLLMEGTLRADGPKGTFIGERAVDLHNEPQPATEITHKDIKAPRIGLLWRGRIDVPDNQNRNFWSPIILSVERSLAVREAVTLPVDTGHPSCGDMPPEDAVRLLDKKRVDGIISVFDQSPTHLERMIQEAKHRHIPMVHAGGTLSRTYRLSVYFSSVDGGFQAASHLFSRGCRNIVFFSAYQAEWVHQRLRGAREAAADFGLSDAAVVVSIGNADLYPLLGSEDLGDVQASAAFNAATALLRGGMPADGVLAVNDQNALGFLKAAQNAGLNAGKDYAIIGFDDFSEAFTNDLSSIRPPLEAVGREAVAMMLREIREPGLTLRTCLPSELIPRASTMSFHKGGGDLSNVVGHNRNNKDRKIIREVV